MELKFSESYASLVSKAILNLLFVLLCTGISSSVFAASYTIDPQHSDISFEIPHLGISKVHGSFPGFEGKIIYDPLNLSKSSTEAKISIASIFTGVKARDEHLLASDFFDAKKFPEASFKSTAVTKISDNKLKIKGNLTIRGVTKEVILDTEITGMVFDPMAKKQRIAFSAQTKINRQDFGISYGKLLDNGNPMIGNEVRIVLTIEALE